jgi:hypothetical protein
MVGDFSTSGKRNNFQQDIDSLTPSIKTEILEIMPQSMSQTRYLNHNIDEPMPQGIPHYIQLPPFPLFDSLKSWIETHSAYTHIPLTQGIMSFIKSREFENDMIVGNFSATDTSKKLKYVTQIPNTKTEIANAYIKFCTHQAGKKLKPVYNANKERNKSAPTHYFSGYYEGDLAYVDMWCAYWSILWPTCIDQEYDPKTQEIVEDGTIPYLRCDEFAKAKDIRNILHTLYGYRTTRIWDHKKKMIKHRIFASPTYRPYNLSYIYDVMNAIVSEIKEKFTLLQWLTDAAIVPANEAENLMEYLFGHWWIDSKIKYKGHGKSIALNVYEIGQPIPHTTAHSEEIRNTKGRYTSSLKPANIEGLKNERRMMIRGW